tara:strand:+ start:7995 stop:10082 length:2088 start_codon:yes stop_codon:yes gene_type:complete
MPKNSTNILINPITNKKYIVIDAEGHIYLYEKFYNVNVDSTSNLHGASGKVVKVFPAVIIDNNQKKRVRCVDKFKPGIYNLDNLSSRLSAKLKNFIQAEGELFNFDKENPFAMKIFKKGIDFSRAETNARFLYKLYPKGSLEPVRYGESGVFIISEFIQGEPLKAPLFDNYKEWHFHDRIEFIWQIFLQLHQLHNNTPNGRAGIHLDLKPANILIEFINQKKANDFISHVNAKIIDFDLSYDIKSSITDFKGRVVTRLDQAVYTKVRAGTPLYIAPEIIIGDEPFIGERTDLYSLAAIIFAVFGAIDPLICKKEVLNRIQTSFNNLPCIQLDEAGLLGEHMIPSSHWLNTDPEFKKYIFTFLCSLGSVNYNLRPTTERALKFFTSLRLLNICFMKVSEFIKDDVEQNREQIKDLNKSIKIYKKKLIDLACCKDPSFIIIRNNHQNYQLSKEEWFNSSKYNDVLIFNTENNDWFVVENNWAEQNDCKLSYDNCHAIINPSLLAYLDYLEYEGVIDNTVLTHEARRIYEDIVRWQYNLVKCLNVDEMSYDNIVNHFITQKYSDDTSPIEKFVHYYLNHIYCDRISTYQKEKIKGFFKKLVGYVQEKGNDNKQIVVNIAEKIFNNIITDFQASTRQHDVFFASILEQYELLELFDISEEEPSQDNIIFLNSLTEFVVRDEDFDDYVDDYEPFPNYSIS